MKYKNLIIIIIYLLICLIPVFFKTPFYDEAHSYMISQLSLSEIFNLTKIEGHPALWYLLNKIFCPNLSNYPYNILLLNWIIYCLLTLFIFFLSPFNLFAKILILFSYPFFQYYSTTSRPYGLSVLVLFILAYLYKNSITKKPFLFGISLFICTQLNVFCLFGAFAFYILTIIDFFKNKFNSKKAILIISVLFLLGLFLFLAQVFNLNIEQMRDLQQIEAFRQSFLKFIFPFYSVDFNINIFQNIFYWLVAITFYLSTFIFYKTSKHSFIFLSLTYLLTTIFFFNFYIGSFWHYFFYFIYLIIAYWISYEKFKDQKFLNYLFTIILFFLITPYSLFYSGKSYELETSHYKIMLEEIKNLNQNSKFFCFDYYSPFSAGVLPYLTKEKITIYDINFKPLNSFESLKMTFKNKNLTLDLDEFILNLDKNKKNYLINQATNLTKNCFKKENLEIIKNKGFIYKNKNHSLYFKNIKYFEGFDFAIYEIIQLN